MMSDNTEPDTNAEQAVDTEDATDADHIRERLPDDIAAELTRQAFSPGSIRKVLRDTYYVGPIAIGTGGWRGLYGGQPGTGMRRPNGALYNFPRSWRFAALQRAMDLGLIIHVGAGFVTTERGVAVLRLIDECPDCGEVRVPGIRSTFYEGNPNSEGHMESHDLITYCPDCGGDGYHSGSVSSGVSEYDRDDEHVERAMELIADHPSARTFGGEREVSEDAAFQSPDVDPDATEDRLETLIEEQEPPSARDVFGSVSEGLFGRPAVTVPSEGAHYRFRGTTEAVSVARTDTEGDIHITLDSEDRLKVGMDYHAAVDLGVKDALHYEGEDADWNGDYWTVAAWALPRVISKLTCPYTDGWKGGFAWCPDYEDEEPPEDGEWLDITVSADAMDACDVPMLGVTEDGDLA